MAEPTHEDSIMVMFGGAFGDDLYGDKENAWGALQQHYQGGKKDSTGFELDTSGLNAVPENPYEGMPDVFAAPDEETSTFAQAPADDTFSSPVNPYAGAADTPADDAFDYDDFIKAVKDAGYDPNNITNVQYKTLLLLMQQYGLAASDMEQLAKQWEDNQYIEQLQELIDNNAFDKDAFRYSQQSAIQQGSQDLAQKTLGQMIAAGQLNSSMGQNYMAGSQAKYLTNAMAKLERDILTEEDKRAAQEGNWLQIINNMTDSDKKAYADMMSKALGLKIDGASKFFDGLSQLLNNEINWSKFLANYTNGTLGKGTYTWHGQTLTDGDFGKPGLNLSQFFASTTMPWDQQFDQGNGYTTMKHLNSDGTYQVSYFKDGAKLFDYQIGSDPDWTQVARALWSKFDTGMQDNWGEYYNWGTDDGDDGDDGDGDDGDDGDTDYTWHGKTLTDSDFETPGLNLSQFLASTELDWDRKIDQGNDYTTMKHRNRDGTTNISYYLHGVKLFDYLIGDNPNWTKIARDLWGLFDDGMRNNWGEYYNWDDSR